MEKLKIEDFDHEFIEVIERLAEALNVKPAVMLENMFIRRIAEDRAADDVQGARPHLMPEFMTYDGEVKRGHELYKILYNMERKQLELERVDHLQQIPWEVLREDQKELMKRYKMDPESKEQKQKDEKEIQDLINSGDIGEVKTTWNKKNK